MTLTEEEAWDLLYTLSEWLGVVVVAERDVVRVHDAEGHTGAFVYCHRVPCAWAG